MSSIKNQRGLMFIELLLALAVLGVLAFVGYRYFATKKAVTEPVVNESAQEQSGEYAGWKTYTSVAEGLSFKYPADWTLKKDPVTTDSEGKKYEKATFTGTNGFQVRFSLRYLDGIGGACEECGVFEVQSINVPNYNLENIYMLITGPDNANQTATVVGLESDPVGGDYSPAVGAGFSFFFGTSKLGGPYKWQLMGAYYGQVDSPTHFPYAEFKDKSEVKTAKKIFKSLTY